MKESKLDIKLIEQIAEELTIDPSFIEKDWYATQILRVIHTLDNKNRRFIFAGGTCLSKAYGIIERFSEDVDFKVSGDFSDRNERRELREVVVKALEKTGLFKIRDIKSENESKQVTIEIDYARRFQASSTLRTHIKVEIVFAEPALPTEHKNINTFSSKYKADIKEEFSVYCMNPAETAAEKFSALLWRVPAMDRKEKLYSIKNDPTLIRHLYDLAALKSVIFNNRPIFKKLVKELYEHDKKRNPSNKGLTLKQAISATVRKLMADKDFENDYRKFVQSMSYSADKIPFLSAVNNLKKVSKIL